MKRFIITILAVLLAAGVTYAAVPDFVDPTAGPEVWTTTVYNNESSTTLDAGDCVEWDVTSATGDNDNYVIQCDSVDTFLVAGVVWPSDISAGDRGSIAIKAQGITVDLLSGGSIIDGTLLCSSATGGDFDECTDSATDANAAGFCTSTPSSDTCTAVIFGR